MSSAISSSAQSTSELVDSASAIRGLMLTARAHLEADDGSANALAMLHVADLHMARLVMNLERVAAGQDALQLKMASADRSRKR